MATIEEIKNLIPISELKKLNTKRLLAFYRSERKKFHCAGYWNSDCEEFIWELYSKKYGYMKEEYQKWVKRLEDIKEILRDREHIERT
jgi:hypothetical protein